MGLFILIKRKGMKKWLGAIPAKKGATSSQLNKLLKNIRKSFSAKVVNSSQLKKVILKTPLMKKIKRRSTKRRVKRRKTKKRKSKR